MKRRFHRILAAVSLVSALASVPPASRAADPFEIHAIQSLTGSLTFAGAAQLAGLQALEDFVNKTGGIQGRPVKFVVQDDQSNPTVALQLTNQLIAKGAPVILGSTLGSSCNAMFPLVKNGPVVYCLSNSVTPEPGGYGFSGGIANPDLIAVGIRYLRLRGWKRIALISSTDTSGQVYDASIDEALAQPENKGVTLVAREHFAPSDISVQAQLARIEAAHPQVLIIGTGGGPFGTVFRGLGDLGLTLPAATGNGAATYAMMRQYSQILPKELYFFSFPSLAADQMTDPATKRALEAYSAELTARGVKADGLESIAWDPALLVVTAYRKLGTNATAAQLRAYLATLTRFTGAFGPYDFRSHPQRGLGQNDAVVVRWDPAKDSWTGVSRPGGVPLK
jgi:branched-chain amino acid transport system substrate-binding protein